MTTEKKSATPKSRKKRKDTRPDTKKQVALLRRRTAALELKTQGLGYQEIVDTMKRLKLATPGYSTGMVYGDIQIALRTMNAEMQELAAENLRLDIIRLDKLLSSVWNQAVPEVDEDGDFLRPPDLLAHSAALSILDRRGKLLNYQSLFATKPEDAPQWNINIDLSQLTTHQIIEMKRRIAQGESPLAIFSEIQQQGNEADKGIPRSGDQSH